MRLFKRRKVWCPASGTPRKCKSTLIRSIASILAWSDHGDHHSIRAILDANRNALMLLELKYSVGTLGLAMGTFIAGLYGMNLENFIEDTNWGFSAVTIVSALMSLWVCRYGLGKLRVLQRVKMSGDSTTRVNNPHSGHWFHDEVHGGLLDPRNREKLRRLNQQKNPAGVVPKKKWFKL